MKKSVEFKPKDVVEMLGHQNIVPYLMSKGVDELLRTYPDQVTCKMATYMYLIGYIEGKRAERVKRKAVFYERNH